MKIKYILQPNFIGKIFRTGCLAISNDKQVLLCLKALPTDLESYEEYVLESYALSSINEFSYSSKKTFGSEFTLAIGEKTLTYKFLKNAQVKEFTDFLNNIIANNITDSLNHFTDEFKEYVVTQYPRDSHIDIISSICEDLHTKFNKHPEALQTYLQKGTLEKAEFVAKLCPVNIKNLREIHENYIVSTE